MRALKAHFLPDLTTPETLAGGVVVVIDVLRASTVIVHALAAGAREVVPCLEIEDARRVAAGLPSGQVVLGGERGGLPIEGFDLGNSPEEYTPEKVADKTVVFTTTNGTRAMQRCRQAKRVLIGAFVNARAVIEALTGEEQIHLLCAGTRGEITREDVLLAGLLAERIYAGLDEAQPAEINDQLLMARQCFRASVMPGVADDIEERLRRELRRTQGGRNLLALGLDRDIDDAARVDRFSIVPELDLRRWTIAAGPSYTSCSA
ncbi:MAG TPA: 2-phosphosulfolactate phosphatase [Pirellulales bacterium]|nr:2-phosphosulfolactate phosphatase [Pirellulales bacterium]